MGHNTAIKSKSKRQLILILFHNIHNNRLDIHQIQLLDL